jgi:hypothetical protein
MLIPIPSDDPRDPLNWPASKKYAIVAVLSWATFAGFTSALAGQLEVGPLAALYKQSTTSLSYQNSSALAGMILGSLAFYFASRIVGRQSAMFWSLLGAMLASVWASLLTKPSDFVSLVISRGFAGFCGTVVGVLGPRCLIDLFFLHQRGRAFTLFHFAFDMGNAIGPSLCALVATPSGDWRWAFRFCIILDGVALLAFFIVMRDTTWNRGSTFSGVDAGKETPDAFLASRIATFLPGTRITPKLSLRQFVRIATPLPFPTRFHMHIDRGFSSASATDMYGFYS